MLVIAKLSRRRTGQAIEEIDRITAKLAVVAEETLRQAKRGLRAAN